MHIKYEKPPILEAVVEIQHEAESGFEVAKIRECFGPLVDSRYPRIGAAEQFQGQFVFGKDTAPDSSVETSQLGFDFAASDGSAVLRAHRNRFSYSLLGKYSQWSDLKSETLRLWGLYTSVVPVKHVQRIAVRYINKLDFPPGELRFEDYLYTFPQVSRAAPDLVTGFFMRLELPQPDIGSAAVVILASAPNVKGNVSMILDIELFKSVNEPFKAFDVSAALEPLRRRKNEYFESAITDKTRKLFGERVEY